MSITDRIAAILYKSGLIEPVTWFKRVSSVKKYKLKIVIEKGKVDNYDIIHMTIYANIKSSKTTN